MFTEVPKSVIPPKSDVQCDVAHLPNIETRPVDPRLLFKMLAEAHSFQRTADSKLYYYGQNFEAIRDAEGIIVDPYEVTPTFELCETDNWESIECITKTARVTVGSRRPWLILDTTKGDTLMFLPLVMAHIG